MKDSSIILWVVITMIRQIVHASLICINVFHTAFERHASILGQMHVV